MTITLIVTVVGGGIALAWVGSGRVTTVEKDVEYHTTKITDNRKSIKANAVDIKKQSDELAEAELRDVRIESQFTQISAHMIIEAKKTSRMSDDISEFKKDYNKAQIQNIKEDAEIRAWIKNIDKVE